MPLLPTLDSRRDTSRAANALIVAIMWIALFAVLIGGVYAFSSETSRRSTRASNFTTAQLAADAAMDVVYGRFSRWVDAKGGYTPSVADAGGTVIPGSSVCITSPISFSGVAGLSDYTVSSISFVPVLPDDSTINNTDFPSIPPSGAGSAALNTYQTSVNKYYVNIANLYEPTESSPALIYKVTLTVLPSTTGDQIHANGLTVTRYLHKSEVSPFKYNVFTQGSFLDPEQKQSYDSEASIYASVSIQLGHKGTIVNGSMRYGDSFIDPTGVAGGINNLVFQDPVTGATVDPYASGLLRKVSKIEVVPDLTDIMAKDSSGNRTAGLETGSGQDNFSRREIIEPPANVTSSGATDTAPDPIKSRRIYTQADQRVKISTYTGAVKVGKIITPTTLASAIFYNVDGTVAASFTGTPSATGTGTTAWVPTSGGSGTTLAGALLAAVNVNPVSSPTPFYDASRTYDTASSGTGQPGQPTAANYGHAIESVDINVGTLTTAINANASAFSSTPTLYIWDDGASGEKNGVRLYNGGVLPDTTATNPTNPISGLVVGTTNPVYVKGDFNSGTVLTTPSDINSAASSVLPASDSTGWNNGQFATVSDRSVNGYTPRPAGIFGDSVTALSQAWQDSASANTQYATSTTFNAVLGMGSGDFNALRADDTFTDGSYAYIRHLEAWNNCRWNQLGEQMALYHSLYNIRKAEPDWRNSGYAWYIIQNDFDPRVARLPLKWGYQVFSRGRYSWVPAKSS